MFGRDLTLLDIWFIDVETDPMFAENDDNPEITPGNPPVLI